MHEEARLERAFVVRLAVQATARDPAAAVRLALDRLLRGGLENFTYIVDDVGNGAKFFVTPADYGDFLAALDRAWSNPGPDLRPPLSPGPGSSR